ncbi:hypothetical protein J7H99_004680, partial [Vibrio parahaemolyticus]|nr:hypothetical protein [Vibrio parahaemolyticus]
MKRRTIWLALFLTACSVNEETNWDTLSLESMFSTFATNTETPFNHLSVSIDTSLNTEVMYEPDVSLNVDFPPTTFKDSMTYKDGSQYFFDSGSVQVEHSDGEEERQNDQNQTSIYIQSKNSNILYISSLISAFGLMLSAGAIYLGRKDKG